MEPTDTTVHRLKMTAPCRANGCPDTADGLDLLCGHHRAVWACRGLSNDITNAVENFLDARFCPHRHGEATPSYYLDKPDFGEAGERGMAEIIEAHALIADGVQRLLQLAMGPRWRVTINDETPFFYDGDNPDDGGIHALIEYSCERAADRPAGGEAS